MKIKFKPMRQKNWLYGKFYIIPTIVYDWDITGYLTETIEKNIHIRWLSYQLSICISRRKEDCTKK